jgi:PTH2 family peptidyl-tRNA hydrolase
VEAQVKRYKQVILIRRDLNMRRGKEIAQGSHASIDFLVHDLRVKLASDPSAAVELSLSEAERAWLAHGMAKVCLQILSEADLIARHEKALTAGLKSFLIRDSGRTEFLGQQTLPACAIGPDETERIDAVTGDLQLY